MKILILTQWCEPEPALKGVALAKALQKLGHEVEILTGFPNYPSGRLYPGFKLAWYRRDRIEDVVVHRVALYPSHDNSAVRRILNYASFAISGAIIGPLVVGKPDVVFAYQPPATIGLPAVALKWLRRAPFVYDVNDLWPDTLRATAMVKNRGVLRAVDVWCNLIYRQAACITVLSPGFARALIERNVPPEKIKVIYNWCDDARIQRAANPQLLGDVGFEGCFNVVFAGTMGKAQGLDAVLDAAALLRDRSRVRFTFVGGGTDVERLKRRTVSESLTNIRFLPQQPMSEIGSLLAAADVLLVHLKNDPLFRITIPSKTQAYLAVGRPILMAVSGDAADLVVAAKAGVVCPPENSVALAEAVQGLANMPKKNLEQMGRNGREFYRSRLSLQIAAEQLDVIFRQVAGGGDGAAAFITESLKSKSAAAQKESLL